MSTNFKLLIVLLLGLTLGGAATWFALHARGPAGKSAPAASTPAAAAAERKILYWYDPMVPDQHFDQPGKSPFMDMSLVPKYADDAAAGGVSIDPRLLQNLGMRTALAEKGRLSRRIDTVGSVRADDNRIELLQARVNGWIERLHVHALGDPVKRGGLIAEVYSPDLYVAQEEFLLARRHPEDAGWIEAARQKMVFLGLSREQIASLEKTGKPMRRVGYYAPISGIVSRIAVHEGAAVNAGTPIIEITDLSRIWVTAEVVENQAAWIAPGARVDITVDSLPGETLEGAVDYLYPGVNAVTRTQPVRIVLANPGLRLKPGMFAKVTLYGGKGAEAVLVPTEAVITTGTRSIVLVAGDAGHFQPVEVKTGIESNGQTAILQGLQGGERVVASGQFLIESEASLKGVLDRLGASAPAAQRTHTGTGRITRVNAGTGELVMQHEPIPSLSWPGMTMEFEVKDPSLLKGLKAGQEVEFDLVDENGDLPVVAIRPRSAPAKPAAGGH